MNKKHTNVWLPKLNYYSKKLSMWQEKLWNEIMPRPYGERWDSDHYSFCNEVYGMTSERIKKYSFTIEPQPILIQKSVSAFPYGTAAAAGVGGISQEINSTVTVGSIVYDAYVTSGGSSFAYLYGYKAINQSHPIVASGTSSGSCGDTAYTDGNSTAQTVIAMGWSDLGISGTPAGETDNTYFGLNGTNRGNTDAVMTKIDYNGTEFLRTAASYNGSVGTAETYWTWADSVNGPTTGTVNFDLWVT